ncbi:MAG: AAA family ATPase [Chloroflexi bacterium]|nr:AAA family ATPase [Chloroflexota bacterium]
MRVKEVSIKGFKRFTDVSIKDLPTTARLVVLIGPNGSGKSSLFDSFRVWAGVNAQIGNPWQPVYHVKQGITDSDQNKAVQIQFHQDLPQNRRKTFYIRSGYRNEADFSVSSVQQPGNIQDAPKVPRLADNDVSVSNNYNRLVWASVAGLYDRANDNLNVKALREREIGMIQDSMGRVFDDLILSGLGEPTSQGTFLFDKGTSREFKYMNLSGGEKGAFDLLLDLIVKLRFYDDTIYCIDEPDLHMHTRLQAKLLDELYRWIPDNSQLWISTHSVGMMAKAKELQKTSPESVVFLDFDQQDFDKSVQLSPVKMTRVRWIQALGVALGDMATLVAPERIVLCEGKPVTGSVAKIAEFDAQCYRRIFANEFPEADFISVGNASDVVNDRLEIGWAIQTISKGTAVTRLVDRDDLTEAEIANLRKSGRKVLTLRHIESYLFDDEILIKLCDQRDATAMAEKLLAAKRSAMSESESRGNPADNVKSAAPNIHAAARQLLNLTQSGSTVEAFALEFLVPLLTPGTKAYETLKKDVFG